MIALKRFDDKNPLLSPSKLAWEKKGVFNPGVAILNNEIILLYRAIDSQGVSRFGLAKSRDGRNFTRASDKPAFGPDPNSRYEEHGVEDPRITFVDNKYAVVYVSATTNITAIRPYAKDWKIRISLAWTKDFKTFDRFGPIMHSYNDKDAALFPVKKDDFYYLYHRRNPDIWLSRSLDLNTWEDVCDGSCSVLEPDKKSWDNDRIGIGSQPIYTEDGWLTFYHGRDNKGVYRLGAFLADHEQPEQILAKLPYPILQPELGFEITGSVPNVVFSCGAIEADGQFLVYYGGADYAIGGAYINKQDLLFELKRFHNKSLL